MNEAVKEHVFPFGQKIQLVQGDITDEVVDAIVNAANSHLAHGAGVAGAIVRRGGRQIQEESDQWVLQHGRVTHGEPAYTHAGNLPCRYVIHAVGPRGIEQDKTPKLSAAVRGSLQRAEELGLTSIAFPAISTGIFGFPAPLAAQVMFLSIEDYLIHHPYTNLNLIRLVLYDAETLQAFMVAWEQDDFLGA
ncbi:MAG TPA: macro domain-containing protein [Anaerolineales bacterium]|nr:macro domain-containing protein [Anaerolineales bacterium]